MKKTIVEKSKFAQALKLDVNTATREEMAAALLVLNDLSLKVQAQIKKVTYTLEMENARLLQTSMFDDEEFSNAVNTVTFTEETTTIYHVDRDAVLSAAGVKSVKYDDCVESRAIVKAEEIIKRHKAGTLDPKYASAISTNDIHQVAMAFGEESKEEESK
jgi:hypothetical protein